jgi:hypothetical protein
MDILLPVAVVLSVFQYLDWPGECSQFCSFEDSINRATFKAHSKAAASPGEGQTLDQDRAVWRVARRPPCRSHRSGCDNGEGRRAGWGFPRFTWPVEDLTAFWLPLGSFVGTRQDMAEALTFAVSGKVKADIEIQSLSSINQIFDRLEHGDVASRVALDFAEPNLRQAAIRKIKEAVLIQMSK